MPALGQFLGSTAGLSAPVITKLTETWKAEQRTFATRDLSGVDYVYLWADGIHVNIRLEERNLCLLVLIGVRADGRKELVALADGYRGYRLEVRPPHDRRGGHRPHRREARSSPKSGGDRRGHPTPGSRHSRTERTTFS